MGGVLKRPIGRLIGWPWMVTMITFLVGCYFLVPMEAIIKRAREAHDRPLVFGVLEGGRSERVGWLCSVVAPGGAQGERRLHLWYLDDRHPRSERVGEAWTMPYSQRVSHPCDPRWRI